jgi:hypothetical protein
LVLPRNEWKKGSEEKRKEKKRKDPKYPTANPGIGRADVLQAILDEEH